MRRKRLSPVDQEALQRDDAIRRAGERYGDVYAEGLMALNHGRGVKAFERAMNAWYDEEEFERRVAEWLEPYIHEDIGRRVRGAGKTSGGRQPHKTPQELRAAVIAMHKLNPFLTFNDACNQVGKKLGYKS